MMRVAAVEDEAALALEAAALVAGQLRDKPDSLLVVPTGATPLGMFRALVAAAGTGAIDFGRCRFAILDEYAGIAPDDRRSLQGWLRRELLDLIGIDDDRIIAFDLSADPAAASARVESAIAANGGIDLAILGLGPNGHLGFNEPGSPFDGRTGLVTLTPESIRSNAAYWGSEAAVPRAGLTLGLGTLRAARRLVLLVAGARKRDILAATLDGPVGPPLPATLLRLHEDATVIADRAAGAFARPANGIDNRQ
jgi:glucosamine-6-phosphate deaminase